MVVNEPSSALMVCSVPPDQVQQTGYPGSMVTVDGEKVMPLPVIVTLACTPVQPEDGLGSPPPGP